MNDMTDMTGTTDINDMTDMTGTTDIIDMTDKTVLTEILTLHTNVSVLALYMGEIEESENR